MVTLINNPLYSQTITTGTRRNNEPNHQLSLQHDNDFFALSDRYYSSGLFLSYTRRLSTWEKGDENQQITLKLGQEVYTPADIKAREISEQDRPYVGFLGLRTGWSRVKENQAVDVSLLLGIAGNNSGAGGFQRWYHKIFVVSDPPVWTGEMNNTAHANLYVDYYREWTLAPLPFSVRTGIQPELAFGTRDQYGQLTWISYFGRRDPLRSSMAHHRIGATSREIYFSLRADYRYVAHNAMLEGNAAGDDSIFLIDALKHLFTAGLDVHHRFGQNEYRFGYRILTPEAKGTRAHKYVSLTYARNF
ncbi:lipid A deacylase LpxR family protein [Muriicola jejuensis]|uniref:lipid A deacylase LpxR family protein n=1 Tax=Muriicola jejuensis TaxID=504488 RepID=UPI001954F5E5|nr:lipid A-modifier LpxR family protein [Muriicola jejuensis]